MIKSPLDLLKKAPLWQPLRDGGSIYSRAMELSRTAYGDTGGGPGYPVIEKILRRIIEQGIAVKNITVDRGEDGAARVSLTRSGEVTAYTVPSPRRETVPALTSYGLWQTGTDFAENTFRLSEKEIAQVGRHFYDGATSFGTGLANSPDLIPFMSAIIEPLVEGGKTGDYRTIIAARNVELTLLATPKLARLGAGSLIATARRFKAAEEAADWIEEFLKNPVVQTVLKIVWSVAQDEIRVWARENVYTEPLNLDR